MANGLRVLVVGSGGREHALALALHADPGVAEVGNRDALARLAPVRAAMPAGVAGVGSTDFERVSAQAFDRAWVETLA